MQLHLSMGQPPRTSVTNALGEPAINDTNNGTKGFNLEKM